MSAPLSEQQLAEIAARAVAAEDGWHVVPDEDDPHRFEIHGDGPTRVAVFGGNPDDGFASYPVRENAEFAAHARQDVPALLAEVEGLRGAAVHHAERADALSRQVQSVRAERDMAEAASRRCLLAWRSARRRAAGHWDAARWTRDELLAEVEQLRAERAELNNMVRSSNAKAAEALSRVSDADLPPSGRQSAAEYRLEQYAQPPRTFQSATERALYEIAIGLRQVLHDTRLRRDDARAGREDAEARVTELEQQLAAAQRRDITSPLAVILRHGDMSDQVRREIADLLTDAGTYDPDGDA